MAVIVRSRKTKTKGTVLYLDIFFKGRRRYKVLSTMNLREAKNIAIQVERELVARGWEDERTPQTLDEFIAEYLTMSKATKADKTYKTDRDSLKAFRQFIGNIDLSDLTTDHVEKFKLKRLGQVKASSVNVALRHVRAALSYVTRKGYIHKNLAVCVKLIHVPKNTQPHFLQADEIAKLRDVIKHDPKLTRMVNFVLWTGVRRNELANLQWSDIDLKRRTVTIRNKPGFRTKSGKSRVIPINQNLAEMLKEMAAAKPSTDDRVAELGYWGFGQRFRKAVLKTGLNDGFSIHTLRHTFASHLVMAGVDLPSIQQILGHHDISMSMVYAHLSPDHLARTVDRLPY